MAVVPTSRQHRLRLLAVYLAVTVAGVLLFFVIRHFGEQLTPSAEAEAQAITPTRGSQIHVVAHVLTTLLAIIALGNLLAWLFRSIGQPAVIGEVVAGIILGPSVLGAIAPDAMHLLVPSAKADPHGEVLSALRTIAQLGVILYMFVVGLELNLRKLRRQAHAAVAISHASIIVPFVLGAVLSLWLYPRLSHRGVPFTSFALFLGVAMAITAFPVLARILTDRRIEKTEVGILAISCAAADDVTAWCLLAVVVGIVQAQLGSAFLITFLSLVFILVMIFIVRPLATRLIAIVDARGSTEKTLPLLFIAVLSAALYTESIGIHALFGAFFLGAMIPHDSLLAQQLSHKLYDVVTILLLPAFFAITGMNTEIGLLNDPESWFMCAMIIVVATAGKFGGSLLAARLVGVNWTTSLALGVLMNTRGLMELIVLNVGLSLGVISPKLFAMMVIMALVTTMATSPLVRLLVDEEAADQNKTGIF